MQLLRIARLRCLCKRQKNFVVQERHTLQKINAGIKDK